MDYAEAVKKVSEMKPKENLVLISIGYSLKMVMPYKDGLAFVAAMNNAELLEENYGRPPEIRGMERGVITFSAMSKKEYEQIRVAQLLQVSLEELKNSESQTT